MNALALILGFVAVATASIIPYGIGIDSTLYGDSFYNRDLLAGRLIKHKILDDVVKTDLTKQWWNPLSLGYGTGLVPFHKGITGLNKYDVVDTDIRMFVDRCVKTGHDIEYCKEFGVKLVLDTVVNLGMDIDMAINIVKNLNVDTCQKLGLGIDTCKYIVGIDKIKLFHILLKLRNTDWSWNTGRDFTINRNWFGYGYPVNTNYLSRYNTYPGIHNLGFNTYPGMHNLGYYY